MYVTVFLGLYVFVSFLGRPARWALAFSDSLPRVILILCLLILLIVNVAIKFSLSLCNLFLRRTGAIFGMVSRRAQRQLDILVVPC